ncbi:aminoglycoside phosphotransferase family protein [Phototrophicus methaneseepsis]|uniref:Aminoglycoside phosphotransferase family protein n=1 Tax=Phototrophicus methaneseepsis TaxID=2710758 RepID=A0A7S8EBU2_9CHLR|nr:aminoglycoside phosphotransferase family protein [Phototrophicus methaneseepsis]QPC83888.1 aminoglycoside phosphotransferase family protein [Phototrophicus methaneseepsis]
MLERPNIADSDLMACLQAAYELPIATVEFLPLGADTNTAVFKAWGDEADDEASTYFVKLRSGPFDEMSIVVPSYLHDKHVEHLIAPLPTRTQRLWASLGDYKVALFPFVAGRDGYDVDLLDRHWVEMGQVLKAIHTMALPTTILERLQRETYPANWREKVHMFQKMAADTPFADPIAAELAAFLKDKAAIVMGLVQRAEQLAAVLKQQPEPFVLCHGDLHAGNVLIDGEQHLYIVDWDTLVLAPRERDLMFVGGGLYLNKRTPEQEEGLFYQGYGAVQANPVALAYYRYERIIQDIAEFCSELLLTDAGGEDRPNSLRLLRSQFRPDSVIAMAYRSESALPQAYKTGDFAFQPSRL